MITKKENNNIFKELFDFIDSEKFKLDFYHINDMERFAIKKLNAKNTHELLKYFYSYSESKDTNSFSKKENDNVFYTINLEKKQLLIKKASESNVNEFNIINRKFVKTSFSHKLFGFLNSTASETSIQQKSDDLFRTFKEYFKEKLSQIQAEYINDFLSEEDYSAVDDAIDEQKILFNLDILFENKNNVVDLFSLEHQLNKYNVKYKKNLFLIKGSRLQSDLLLNHFDQLVVTHFTLDQLRNAEINDTTGGLLVQSALSFQKYLNHLLIEKNIYNAKIFIYVLLMFSKLNSESTNDQLILNQIKLSIVHYLNNGVDNYHLSDILEKSFRYKEIDNFAVSEMMALLDSEYEIFKYHTYPKYLFKQTLLVNDVKMATFYYANHVNRYYKIKMLRFSNQFKELNGKEFFETIAALKSASENNINDQLIEDLRSFCNL